MLMNLERPVSCNLGMGDGKQGPTTHLWFPVTFTFLLLAVWEWGESDYSTWSGNAGWREKMGIGEEKRET